MAKRIRVRLNTHEHGVGDYAHGEVMACLAQLRPLTELGLPWPEFVQAADGLMRSHHSAVKLEDPG